MILMKKYSLSWFPSSNRCSTDLRSCEAKGHSIIDDHLHHFKNIIRLFGKHLNPVIVGMGWGWGLGGGGGGGVILEVTTPIWRETFHYGMKVTRAHIGQ